MTNYNPHPSSSPKPDGNNFYSNTYRPPSPFYLSQEINNGYYSQYPNLSMDRMTPSPLSLQTNKINPIKSNKTLKTGTKINFCIQIFKILFSERYWWQWRNSEIILYEFTR